MVIAALPSPGSRYAAVAVQAINHSVMGLVGRLASQTKGKRTGNSINWITMSDSVLRSTTTAAFVHMRTTAPKISTRCSGQVKNAGSIPMEPLPMRLSIPSSNAPRAPLAAQLMTSSTATRIDHWVLLKHVFTGWRRWGQFKSPASDGYKQNDDGLTTLHRFSITLIVFWF